MDKLETFIKWLLLARTISHIILFSIVAEIIWLIPLHFILPKYLLQSNLFNMLLVTYFIWGGFKVAILLSRSDNSLTIFQAIYKSLLIIPFVQFVNIKIDSE